jgi:hypothetical protein
MLCFLLAVALNGCTEDREFVGLDGGGPALDGGSMPEQSSYKFSGSIGGDSDSGPLANARICAVGHPELPCAVTDSNGTYTMALPIMEPHTELAMSWTAAGHLGFVGLTDFPADGSFGWFNPVYLSTDARAAEWLRTGAGLRYPAPDRAFVLVDISDAVPGSRVTIEPSAGVQTVYSDVSGDFDSTLTEVATGGARYSWSSVLFGEVPPGTVTISIPGCMPLQDLQGCWYRSESTVAAVAVAGSVTITSVICTRNAPAAP